MGNTLDHLFKGKDVEGSHVEITTGPIIGKRIIPDEGREVDAFLGIPFATPPLGELRFKKPIPAEKWTTPRKCYKFGPRSVQKDLFFWMKYIRDESSEDCLYLNVFAPLNKKKEQYPDGLAVMVYIHGGGFVSDSSIKYGDIGISKYLASKDVVVVSIQYRLAYLGFFSTGDEICPGNNGLWDMKLALEWVQDNCARFGGNPGNVTIFGQSAGGCAVELLEFSPHTKHLFHKLIPMGGNAQCNWSVSKTVVERSYAIAAKNGIFERDSHTLLDSLRKLPAVNFATSLKLGDNDIESIAKPMIEIGPRIDGNFLPKSLEELKLETVLKPKLIGVCEAEGLIFQMFMKHGHAGNMEDVIAHLIPESEFPNFKELRSKAFSLYLANDFDHKNKTEFAKHIGRFFSDLFVNIGTKRSVNNCLENGVEPYVYIFTYCTPKQFGLLKYKTPYVASTHCWDISHIVQVGIISNWDFTADDLLVVENMTKFWTNFAKYSNPNGQPGSENYTELWHPATKVNPNKCLKINLVPEMSDHFFENRADFWIDLCNQSKRVSL
uniref:Carboxylic ester hydrolase n=1 Tax=Rhabditophanes sp. KR3021 TaxID=114890 RepID=A0AC35UF05_9BILA